MIYQDLKRSLQRSENWKAVNAACAFENLEGVYYKSIRRALMPHKKHSDFKGYKCGYLNYSGLFSFSNMIRYRRLSYFMRIILHAPNGLKIMLNLMHAIAWRAHGCILFWAISCGCKRSVVIGMWILWGILLIIKNFGMIS